jgi:carboxyl-terminal processing protease
VVHEVGIKPDIQVSGALEQLLRAFNELNVNELTFELRRTKVIVNGIEAAGVVNMIREDKKLLLPIRFLATSIGAELTWDDKAKEVVISINGQIVKYPQSSLKMNENSSYIDIARFSEDFPQMKWNSSVTAPKFDLIKE